MGLDAIKGISMFPPIKRAGNVEHIGGGGASKKIGGAGTVGGNPFAGFMPTGVPNGELTPKLGQQDSSYTAGLGHSVNKRLNYFA